MQKLTVTYTSCDTKEFFVNESSFDNFCLILKHRDLSIEYINRQQIKSVRVWTQLDVDSKKEEDLV